VNEATKTTAKYIGNGLNRAQFRK